MNCSAARAAKLVCYCANMTESDIRAYMAQKPPLSIDQLAEETGAGDGCTSCHTSLAVLISEAKRWVSPPTFSVR